MAAQINSCSQQRSQEKRMKMWVIGCTNSKELDGTTDGGTVNYEVTWNCR